MSNEQHIKINSIWKYNNVQYVSSLYNNTYSSYSESKHVIITDIKYSEYNIMNKVFYRDISTGHIESRFPQDFLYWYTHVQ